MQFERNKFSATRASALRVLQFFPENNKAKKLIRRLDERQRDLKNAQLFLNEGKFYRVPKSCQKEYRGIS